MIKNLTGILFTLLVVLKDPTTKQLDELVSAMEARGYYLKEIHTSSGGNQWRVEHNVLIRLEESGND